MILGPIQIDRSCHITRKGRFSTARTPITTHEEAIRTHTLDSRHRDDEMRGTAQAPRRRRSVTGACLGLEFLLTIPSLLHSCLTLCLARPPAVLQRHARLHLDSPAQAFRLVDRQVHGHCADIRRVLPVPSHSGAS